MNFNVRKLKLDFIISLFVTGIIYLIYYLVSDITDTANYIGACLIMACINVATANILEIVLAIVKSGKNRK